MVSSRRRWLIWMLRAIGLLDGVALIAVFSPREMMNEVHHFLGLGTFPSDPIAGYLARCTSIWYVSYGVLLWFVSFDIQRYSALIRCLAWVMFTQGLFVMTIDIAEGMPIWWIVLEGPCCSALGAGLLLLQRMTASSSENTTVSPT